MASRSLSWEFLDHLACFDAVLAPMPSLAAIREHKRDAKLAQLHKGASALVATHPGCEVWLFGSLARGDWDAYSDVDLLAIAPSKAVADGLADGLLSAGLADDVIALSQDRWQALKSGDDPYWRAIGNDALRLDHP